MGKISDLLEAAVTWTSGDRYNSFVKNVLPIKYKTGPFIDEVQRKNYFMIILGPLNGFYTYLAFKNNRNSISQFSHVLKLDIMCGKQDLQVDGDNLTLKGTPMQRVTSSDKLIDILNTTPVLRNEKEYITNFSIFLVVIGRGEYFERTDQFYLVAAQSDKIAKQLVMEKYPGYDRYNVYWPLKRDTNIYDITKMIGLADI